MKSYWQATPRFNLAARRRQAMASWRERVAVLQAGFPRLD
jgi:hypothetical protein